ncbi:HAD family hydrolase [Lactobacillus xylocopicola]|uniref:Hydrolase n=1 Tax=Lactobacillus xylocopicola TaxID=2976676 RepID=A0ABM8BGJ6_9LACO|nr:HAD family phosphatase [Lactobacillus xylocopicola]BDR60385.1 hydrolase [Lactobacillus xylocopicola]
MRVQGSKADIKGILFDMDGLLVNSERLYWKANIQAAKEANLGLSDDVYLSLVGSTNADMTAFYHRYFADDEQRDRFIKRTDELAWQWTDEGELKLQAGVQAALDTFAQLGLPMAIVSSNTEAVVEHNLWVTGIRNYFQFHLNSADVKKHQIKPKPAPDIYLLALAKLGLPAANVLAFEDSSTGLQAAVNAGVECVMIPDLLPASKKDEALALMVCPNFKKFLQKV